MTRVSHVNDVAVVDELPPGTWQRVERDLTRPATTRAIRFKFEGKLLWIAKANCRIYQGCYYAQTFAIESAKQWAAAAQEKTR